MLLSSPYTYNMYTDVRLSHLAGIILVHDLTNRKSQQNLQKWLAEVINRDASSKLRVSSFEDFDPEQFVGSTQVIQRPCGL
jgi:Rab-like protein 3